jgi:AraC-like DNA-binding protein
MKLQSADNSISKNKKLLFGVLSDLDIRPLYAGLSDLPTGAWNYVWLPNDFWRLYRHNEPGGILICDDEPIELIPEGIYLIPNNMKLASKNTRQIKQFFVHFDIRGISQVAFRSIFAHPILIESDENFLGIIDSFSNKIVTSSWDEALLYYHLKGIIYSAFGYCFETMPDNLLESGWDCLGMIQPLAPALQLIDKRLDQPMTNKELAKACSMSENYFISRFRQVIGMTPALFVQQKRLAMAAQLLIYTNDSIDEVALKTGYSDRFYFSRAFRRATGCPPAAYRRFPRT